jgi:succinoglycan biosynthesis transport protein ExoP
MLRDGPLRSAEAHAPQANGAEAEARPVRAEQALAAYAHVARLWQHRWLMAGTFFVVLALSLIAIWTTVGPEYRAEALLRISPVIQRLVFNTDDNGAIPLYMQFVNTQVAAMSSPRVLERVLTREDVRRTAWYRSQRKPRQELLQTILLVSPKQKSELVGLAVTVPAARDASVLANAVAHEYLTDLEERTHGENARLFAQLVEERDQRSARIREIEELMIVPRRELGTGDVDGLLTERMNRVEAKRAELLAARQQIDLVSWQHTRFEKRDEGGAAEGESRGRFQADAIWQQTWRELRQLQNRLELELDSLGPRHPTIRSLQKEIDLTEQSLRERERQLSDARLGDLGSELVRGDTGPPLTLAESHERLEYLRQRERLIQRDLDILQGEYERTRDNAELLKRREAELHHEKELYEAVRTRLVEKQVESRVFGAVRLEAEAIPPTSAFRDRRKLFSAMALVASLVAAVGAAMAYSAVHPSGRAPGERRASGAAPFFEELPLVTLEGSTRAPEVLSEAARIVRTTLLDVMEHERVKIFQVTSAGSGAGKTEVAVLLAKSLAACRKRVLLVDADLRGAQSVAERFDLPEDGPGLVAELTSRAGDARAVLVDVLPQLSILPAGAQDEAAQVELLAGGMFRACLERWRTRYDVVLIDGPPVLPVADARIIARQVDGTIFVVREGLCVRDNVSRALSALRQVGGRTVGLIYLGSAQRGRFAASDAQAEAAMPDVAVTLH